MEHDHAHDHHNPVLTSVNKAFVIGIVLNVAFVIIELLAGYYYSSLALLSDAGHNLTDVSGLLISLVAFKLTKVKSNERYTYGYKKAWILASLLNAILLLATVGIIVWEGFMRLNSPRPLAGNVISLVALVGIFVNAASAFLFFREKEKDINIKGAYLHLLADALVSLGVVVSGVIISFTGLFWIDTAVSFIIAAVILISTWRLLTDSIRLALDGIPAGIDLEKVKQQILAFNEITSVHHIHIWALSSNQNALTAHVVISNKDLNAFEPVKNKLKHELSHLNIQHVTLEPELKDCHEPCSTPAEHRH